MITEPIDLKTIATKIVDGEYTAITQCEDDLYQMCKNAMTFNEPGSQVMPNLFTKYRVFHSC